jgi:putative nucleotidyltransferase with HDIG domain
MRSILVVTDTQSKAAAIRAQLDGRFALRFVDVSRISEADAPGRVLCDIELINGRAVIGLRDWLRSNLKPIKLILAIDRASHLQAIQVKALGADAIIHRPIESKALIRALAPDLGLLFDENRNDPLKTAPGIGKALDALRGIFASACVGTPLNATAINAAGEAVIERMEEYGLSTWVETVQQHHSQTYQHCLIVTGVAVAFAQHLGCSRSDQLRLSFGAMLHDIGKARIPLEVLEKPSTLTRDEMTLMSKHPEYGLEALKGMSGLKQELLDIVVHHHEYLDGSGYPHRLSGSEIPDLVRIVTICDIFGALLERRAYKAPLPPETAYQILLEMEGKLDKDLVRAFGFTQRLRFDPAA